MFPRQVSHVDRRRWTACRPPFNTGSRTTLVPRFNVCEIPAPVVGSLTIAKDPAIQGCSLCTCALLDLLSSSAICSLGEGGYNPGPRARGKDTRFKVRKALETEAGGGHPFERGSVCSILILQWSTSRPRVAAIYSTT